MTACSRMCGVYARVAAVGGHLILEAADISHLLKKKMGVKVNYLSIELDWIDQKMQSHGFRLVVTVCGTRHHYKANSLNECVKREKMQSHGFLLVVTVCGTRHHYKANSPNKFVKRVLSIEADTTKTGETGETSQIGETSQTKEMIVSSVELPTV